MNQNTYTLLTNVDFEITRQLNNLLRQHVPESPEITMKHIQEMLDSKCSHIFIAKKSDGKVIGMATLIHAPKLDKGFKSIVEDVVVDADERGNGVGGKLMELVIATAKELGANQLSLTSNPLRIAANKLYQKFGFQIRDTNYYIKNI